MNGTQAKSGAAGDPVARAPENNQPTSRRACSPVDVQAVPITSPSRRVRNGKIVSDATSAGQLSSQGSPLPGRSGLTLTNNCITQSQQPSFAITLMAALPPGHAHQSRSLAVAADNAGRPTGKAPLPGAPVDSHHRHITVSD